MYLDEYDQTSGLPRSSHHRLQTAPAYCISAPTGHLGIAFYQPSLEKMNKIKENPKARRSEPRLILQKSTTSGPSRLGSKQINTDDSNNRVVIYSSRGTRCKCASGVGDSFVRDQSQIVRLVQYRQTLLSYLNV